MKPLDPRLVREARATAGYLFLVVALAIFATLSTVAIAYFFASFVVGVFTEGRSFESQVHLLGYALIAASARALIHFAGEWAGFFAAGKVKLELRDKALSRLEAGGSDLVSKYGSGELSSLLGPGLDAIDVYFAKYLPQLMFTAIVTPGLTALIWFMDPASGLTVLLTLPLIPLFMALIGYVTKDLQDRQLDSLERLNGHFLEIIKGLVTLKIFNRIERQQLTLLEVADQYRKRTMKVLRVSFLSGFALELAASLSVALIAVSIGIRLVDGNLGLFIGLFILIIAPEVYLPLRNVGAQFHLAASGVSVSSRVLDLIGTPLHAPKPKLVITHPGLTAVIGPSGIGKSQALKALVGPDSVWLPQTSQLLPGTVGSNVVGFGESKQLLLAQAMEFAGIAELNIEQSVAEDSLSGGQRQRVALARAIYRLWHTNSRQLLLDEPTSQLDTETSKQIIARLKQLASSGIQVIAVTHAKELIESADQVVEIG